MSGTLSAPSGMRNHMADAACQSIGLVAAAALPHILEKERKRESGEQVKEQHQSRWQHVVEQRQFLEQEPGQRDVKVDSSRKVQVRTKRKECDEHRDDCGPSHDQA